MGTNKKVKFLYKGDLTYNSGFDLLLKAYSEEFIKDEDVSLVVLTSKDNLTEERQKLLNELIKNYDSPEVIFVENNNDESNLASFYKSASFFVSTHRQDSYCFDILSSMGCATPAIVTDFGAVLDYCDNDNSILVKAEKIYQKEKSVDGLTTTSYPYLPEVDLISLRVELRKAYEMDLDTYQKLSNKAYKTVVDNFTLIKINEKIKENLYALLKTPIKQNETLTVNKKILEGLNTLNSGDYSIATNIL
ncbi:MAG: glycosyltransferase, partial [Candidatus Sericytochromatia bacterium]